MWRGSVAGVVLLALAGCGSQDGTPDAAADLATVAGQPITAADLDRYERALPDHLRSQMEGVHAHRAHLQSLVDTRLMLREGEKRGLDRLPALQQELSAAVDERIAGELRRELVSARVTVAEQDLRAAYEEHLLGWEIWPAHILSATEEDAREIIRLLEEGADFSELARQRSLADDADRGGDLRGFFGPGDAVPTLREGAFRLEEGQISEPIPTMEGFEVVKVIRKRRVPFEKLRPEIAEQLIRRKELRRLDAVVDSLKQARDLRFHRDRIHAVLEGLHGGASTEPEARVPLIEYAGGVIDVGEAVLGLRGLPTGVASDSATACRTIELGILPDSLLAVEARDRGWQRREPIVEWQERERQSLIASRLRQDELAGKVEVTEAEVRARYEEHIETYKSLPGVIHMTEVLCDTRAEAEAVLARARAGERLEVLAVRHSVRPGMEAVGGHTFTDSGRVVIGSLYSSPYRQALGDSNTSDVGVPQGPLEVQGKYSIFRLDRPFEMAPVPFERVRQPIRTRMRRNRESVLFDAFLDSLRQAYAEQVQIDEEALARYAATR